MPRNQQQMSDEEEEEEEDELDQLEQPTPAQQPHLSQSGTPIDTNSPRARRKTQAVNYNYRGRTVIAPPLYSGPLFAKSANARAPKSRAPTKKLPITKPRVTKKAEGVASKFERLVKGRVVASTGGDVDMLDDDEEEKEVVRKKKGKAKATEVEEDDELQSEGEEVIVKKKEKKKKKVVKSIDEKKREKSPDLYQHDDVISASPTPVPESPLTLSGLNQKEDMNDLDMSVLLQDMGDELEKEIEDEEAKKNLKENNKNAIASTSNNRSLSPEPPAPPVIASINYDFLSLLHKTKERFATLENHQKDLHEYLKEKEERSKEKDLKMVALEAKVQSVEKGDAEEKGNEWREEVKALKEKLRLSEEETKKERKEKDEALERLRAMEYMPVDEEVSQGVDTISQAKAD